MGRKKKYLTEDQKREAERAANRRSRAKKKGAVTWSKRVADGLAKKAGIAVEAVTEAASGSESAPQPERSGEPFAGLGAPSLPTSDVSATAAQSSEASPGESSAASSTATDDTKSSAAQAASTGPTEGRIFDAETIKKMAFSLGQGFMQKSSAYCQERGYFSFGEPMDKVVGMACSVIVGKWAERANIDDEEGAAYVVGIFAGVNALQGGRALYADKKKRDQEERMKHAAAASAQRAQQAAKGISPEDVARQAAERRPVERAAAGSLGVI